MLGGESNLVRLHPAPTESPDAATRKVGIAVVGATLQPYPSCNLPASNMS
jgi:hypothetical protein